MERHNTVAGIALTVLVVAVAFSGAAAAHSGDDGAHHHDGWMGAHDGMGWGLWFLWPAVVLLVAGVGAYLLLTRGNGGNAARSGDDALDTLRERYARGDIDEEEFERRRQTLETDGH